MLRFLSGLVVEFSAEKLVKENQMVREWRPRRGERAWFLGRCGGALEVLQAVLQDVFFVVAAQFHDLCREPTQT